MISYISGKVIDNNDGAITILTSGGVGYIVYIKPNAVDIFKVDSEVQILTYLSVSENALNLYGFANKEELELFRNFLNVSGIGPKSALYLLSLGTVDEIQGAIINGDIEYLTKVSGVGKRTAERIVVELKNKMGDAVVGTQGVEVNENLSDVIDGLMAMGYSVQQAREAVKKLDTNGKTSEALLKEALQGVK